MNVIFDLDGTLSDSSEGIIYTFKEVFARLGLPPLPEETARTYIGPPLEDSFAVHLPPDRIQGALELYRKLYVEKGGIMMNKLYPGIKRLLKRLKLNGHKLFVATTKEINAASAILQAFGIMRYFEGVYGTSADKGLFNKRDVLVRLFEDTGVDKSRSILIGDTVYDADGGEYVGIKVGIVLYGFGTRQSVADKKIEFFVDSVGQLSDWFFNRSRLQKVLL